jgi:hypothetical protein
MPSSDEVVLRTLADVEAKVEGLEAWRGFYLEQENLVIDRIFKRLDEVFALVASVRADLSRIAGEREAERRITMMAIGVLSAATGALIAHFFRLAG